MLKTETQWNIVLIQIRATKREVIDFRDWKAPKAL